MAVLPQFMPENAAFSRTGDALLQGEQIGQSMMERKQRMQIAAAEEDRQKQEFIAKMPVIQAQAAVQITGAHAAINNAAMLERLHAKANAESAGYNNEFLDAMQLADWNARADALAALQPKISYLALFPEYKGFVDTVNNQRVQSHTSAIADVKLEEASYRADELLAGRKYVADVTAGAGVEKATIAAGAKLSAADIYTQSKERQAKIAADTKLSVEDKRIAGQNEKQSTQIRSLTNAADAADEQAAEASFNGDEESAKIHRQTAANYRGAAAKMASYAGEPAPVAAATSRKPRPAASKAIQEAPPAAVSIDIPGSELPPSGAGAAPAGEPGAGAPVVAQPAAPAKESVAPRTIKQSDIKNVNGVQTISVGGKDLPVFRDAKGNLAYKLHGVWVEVTPETKQ